MTDPERPPVDPLREEAERIVNNGAAWASRYAFDVLRAALAPAAPRPEGLDLGPGCRGESPDGPCDDEMCEGHALSATSEENR